MTIYTKKSKKKKRRAPHDERLFHNLLKATEQFMTGKHYRPVTREELLERLSLPVQHEPLLQQVLDQLIALNLIQEFERRYAWKQSAEDIVRGVIRMHPRGFGFVQPQHATRYIQDIFVPKHLTKNAVDGDEVEVLVNPEVSEKGPEGRIVTILKRARSHMAGIVRRIDRDGRTLAYLPLLGAQQRVVIEQTEEHILRVGDRVVVEILEWGSKETETLCRFSHYLGNMEDPSCDIEAAIEEFELRTDFSTEVLEEARQFGQQVTRTDLKQRKDLRNMTCFTIDPDTAKDFDDALSVTREEDGTYRLGVHIADVSHYVCKGSALDEEARLRCNSTYFPGRCIPMLPSVLSENLCSLKPNVNRLAVSILIHLDDTGHVLSYQICRSVIRSAKRFTYKEAKQVLDGRKRSKHRATLELMVEVCRLLKKKRYERGSLEFTLPELIVLVDEKGTPHATEHISYDITHQMVEEFMLKANEIVACELTERSQNMAYRVHEEPSPDNLREFASLAAAFGFKVPDLPNPRDLQELFETAHDTPYASYLASSYIRRMRLATYSVENIGHYGLSLTHYCHFTSPIRRYIDLVIHRILFGDPDDFTTLQDIATRCSEQERLSAKAEQSVVMLKKLRLIHTYHQEDRYRSYDAMITRVKNFGIYFEMFDLLLEGFIHISEIGEDYFAFDETKGHLRGTTGGEIYAPGDRITVMVREVDLVYQEAKWELIAHGVDSSSQQKKRQDKKKREHHPASSKEVTHEAPHPLHPPLAEDSNHHAPQEDGITNMLQEETTSTRKGHRSRRKSTQKRTKRQAKRSE